MENDNPGICVLRMYTFRPRLIFSTGKEICKNNRFFPSFLRPFYRAFELELAGLNIEYSVRKIVFFYCIANDIWIYAYGINLFEEVMCIFLLNFYINIFLYFNLRPNCGRK